MTSIRQVGCLIVLFVGYMNARCSRCPQKRASIESEDWTPGNGPVALESLEGCSNMMQLSQSRWPVYSHNSKVSPLNAYQLYAAYLLEGRSNPLILVKSLKYKP